MNSITLTSAETRASIDNLEHILLEANLTTDFSEYTFHHFGDGTYVRELRLPANCILVGVDHCNDEVCLLTKGVIIIQSEFLDTSKVYQAPYIFVAGHGKKAGLTLENTIFVTIHPNPDNCRDIDELERRMTKLPFQAMETLQ